MTDRVFVDANIVSTAWRVDAGLLALWELADTVLLTSAYTIVEADRNVQQAEQRTLKQWYATTRQSCSSRGTRSSLRRSSNP